MHKRQINFYIAALLITLTGSLATLVIVKTAFDAELAPYTSLETPLK
jgi:hypothetical protein